MKRGTLNVSLAPAPSRFGLTFRWTPEQLAVIAQSQRGIGSAPGEATRAECREFVIAAVAAALEECADDAALIVGE